MGLAATVIFLTENELCLSWTLTALVGGLAQPVGDVLRSQIVANYPAGTTFPDYPPLTKAFRLVKVTAPIVTPTIPTLFYEFMGACFMRAHAYYLPVDEPLPPYPAPGTGPYEGGNTMPQPDMGFSGGGGRSGGGGASGSWDVEDDPDTGGAWYLPRRFTNNTVTAAFTSFNNNNGLSDNNGFVAFFWVFSGAEAGEQHILDAPFHSWTSRGTEVSFPGLYADVSSDLIDAPGFNGVLYGYGVGRFQGVFGDVYLNEINVNIYESPDYPAMYFPPRDDGDGGWPLAGPGVILGGILGGLLAGKEEFLGIRIRGNVCKSPSR